MADCLSLLRQYNIQKKEIVERDGLVIFDSFAWPKGTRTNYLVYKPGQGGVKEYYTLESLLFLLKNVSLSHPMYVQRAGNQKIPVITLPDRRGLLSYLNGETDSTPSIDKSVHPEMGMPAPPPKRPSEESLQEGAKRPRLESEEMRAKKQHFAEMLQAKGKKGAITDHIRPLGDSMSVEMIAAIKAKRLAKIRATIKTDEDLGHGNDHGFVDDDVRVILKKERIHRNRSTILQSSGKTFSTIFTLLQSVKAREEGKMTSGGAAKQSQLTVEKPMRSGAPALGYNRYGQEQFGAPATGEFQIDTTGTYHGMNIKKMAEVAAKPRPQPEVTKQPDILRNEQAAKKPADIPKPTRRDHQSRTPIIIVPAVTTSIITTYNAKDFLEGFRYVSLDEKKRSGAKRETELLIQRKKPNPSHPGQTLSIPYRITSNPLKLSSQDWKQVVAVFVAGPFWQFKGWPGVLSDGSPVDIFTKMKAFHIRFDEIKLDSNIQKWDVEILTISKGRRHLDKACMMRFWETMDRFMSKHFPDLRF